MNNLEKLLRDYENGDYEPLYNLIPAPIDCRTCPFFGKCLDTEGGCAELRARWLLAEYVEPDSLEKIHADASKCFDDYWGCGGYCCQDCPVMIDGRTPDERFNVATCIHAQSLDIHRRIRDLTASEGVSNDEN